MKQTSINSTPGNSAPRKVSLLRKSIPFLGVAFIALIALAFIFKNQKSKAAAPEVKHLQVTSEEPAHSPDPSDSNYAMLFREKMDHILNKDSSGKWTIDNEIPPFGAILPYKRIVAYYGNLYSKQMGILGELPPAQMLAKLQEEVKVWEKADTAMEVQPALHYIAVTAQSQPGKGGKYRLRMPFHQIDSVLKMAAVINAIVFLDIQVGLSTLQSEIPELEKYLSLPNVHLGIDPEFSMKTGKRPGAVVGTYSAEDINYASNYLADLVKKHQLPPKILVVHRFTQGMVTDYKKIKTPSGVQIVMHMDGWGQPAKKINTYRQFIYREPVDYTGFKIFYKNDTKNNSRLLTPEELMKLKPRPVYIQYQ